MDGIGVGTRAFNAGILFPGGWGNNFPRSDGILLPKCELQKAGLVPPITSGFAEKVVFKPGVGALRISAFYNPKGARARERGTPTSPRGDLLEGGPQLFCARVFSHKRLTLFFWGRTWKGGRTHVIPPGGGRWMTGGGRAGGGFV